MVREDQEAQCLGVVKRERQGGSELPEDEGRCSGGREEWRRTKKDHLINLNTDL